MGGRGKEMYSKASREEVVRKEGRRVYGLKEEGKRKTVRRMEKEGKKRKRETVDDEKGREEERE